MDLKARIEQRKAETKAKARAKYEKEMALVEKEIGAKGHVNGGVYAVAQDGLIKIGMTKNFASRFKNYLCNPAHSLEIIGAIGIAIEKTRVQWSTLTTWLLDAPVPNKEKAEIMGYWEEWREQAFRYDTADIEDIFLHFTKKYAFKKRSEWRHDNPELRELFQEFAPFDIEDKQGIIKVAPGEKVPVVRGRMLGHLSSKDLPGEIGKEILHHLAEKGIQAS